MIEFTPDALFKNYGFTSLFFIAFMFLLKWVLKTQEKILDTAKEERAYSQMVIQGFLKTIEQMNIQSNEFHRQVTEAHSYQRNEHNKVIEGLSNITAITQKYTSCLENIKCNLEEQYKILLHINEYKHID